MSITLTLQQSQENVLLKPVLSPDKLTAALESPKIYQNRHVDLAQNQKVVYFVKLVKNSNDPEKCNLDLCVHFPKIVVVNDYLKKREESYINIP